MGNILDRVAVTVTIPEHMDKRLRLTGVLHGLKLSEMVEEAIAKYLDQMDEEHGEIMLVRKGTDDNQ